jgi:hypothetical protein
MDVNCIAFHDNWVTIEYEESGLIQRRLVPRLLIDTNRKGVTRVPDEVVQQGLEYSDVDLPAALGQTLPAVMVLALQDDFRRRGLWRKQDYKTKSSVVAGVLARVRGLDLATVTNAAMKHEVYDASKDD